MELAQIKADLDDTDSQKRLKAIAALREFETEIAVPLLISRIEDKEFLVRSFVAMGLGKKQNAESFAALLELMKFDRDPNVRAEAANSLSLFGQVAAAHLVVAFDRDDHWLVRRSILAAAIELDTPEELLDICIGGLKGDDLTVRETSIDCLVYFAGTSQGHLALEQILSCVNDESWRIRVRVARSLSKYKDIQAIEALGKLKQDPDSRVVGAVLESGLSG